MSVGVRLPIRESKNVRTTAKCLGCGVKFSYDLRCGSPKGWRRNFCSADCHFEFEDKKGRERNRFLLVEKRRKLLAEHGGKKCFFCGDEGHRRILVHHVFDDLMLLGVKSAHKKERYKSFTILLCMGCHAKLHAYQKFVAKKFKEIG